MGRTAGPGADKDIDKRGGFWYSTKVPCANDTRWCGAMAAQLICNQWVAGSTPVTSSKKNPTICRYNCGVYRGIFALSQCRYYPECGRNVGGMWDNLQKMGFCGTGCTRILYAPAYIIRLYNELSLPLLWAGCVVFHDAPTYSPHLWGSGI